MDRERDVCAPVPVGISHRFRDDGSRREVDHAVDLLRREGLAELRGIVEPSLDQVRERGDGVPVAGGEVVQNDRGAAVSNQLADDDASDVSRAADHEEIHGRSRDSRMRRMALSGSRARKIEWPATNVSAPAREAMAAVFSVMPPSTWRMQSYRSASSAAR